MRKKKDSPLKVSFMDVPDFPNLSQVKGRPPLFPDPPDAISQRQNIMVVSRAMTIRAGAVFRRDSHEDGRKDGGS
ncbi:MAG: hypothetical protein KAV83_11720 [Desulfobacterales bacterium]|nr:hypothetical protein [Desulfobacterales bacterium]